MSNCPWTPQHQHFLLVHSGTQAAPVPVHGLEAGDTVASDAGGVPGIPWHHIPAPWGTALYSTGCVMTQILTIAWSPGRTCVSGPCLTYPPSTVETTQQSIKHIHHQLWKQHNSQSNISTINCGNNTTVNQTYPPSTVETTQQSIKHIHHPLWKQHNSQSNISTINRGNNTTVNQTYSPSTVETTQQSIKHIRHQLWKQQLIKHIHHQLWKQHNNSQSNISTTNCGNNTTVSQTHPPSTVKTTQCNGQSGFPFHHALCLLSVKLTLPQNNSNNLSLENKQTTTTKTKNKTKKRIWGHVKKQSSALRQMLFAALV